MKSIKKNLNIILLCIVLVLIIVIITIYSQKEHFQTTPISSNTLPVDLDDNTNFVIRDENSEEIMNLINLEDYIVEPDQVIPGQNFKMIKFVNDNSKISIKRKELDKIKSLTFGFYFKVFLEEPPKIYTNFVKVNDSKSDFSIKCELDTTVNKIKIEWKDPTDTNNSIHTMNINNPKALNYFIIQLQQPSVDNGEYKIVFNLNNIKTVFKQKSVADFRIDKLEINGSFKGFIGKILVFNRFLDKLNLCTYYNCNISCFKPDGTKTYNGNVNKCIEECNKTCNDIVKCQKICIDCEVEDEEWDIEKKKKMCPWLKEIKKLDKSAPFAPKIRCFSSDSKVLVEWKRPFDGRGEIQQYIIMAYETFNKKNGIIVNIADNPECDICSHEMKNLKNQVFYDIIVKGVNNYGIGKASNIVTIAPNGEQLKNDLNNIFFELDDDLDKSISYNDTDIKCDNITYQRVQNHNLDKDIIDVKELINKKIN